MSDGVPPEKSDPLATPEGTVTVRSDGELRNHLYKLFGVDLNTAEERVSEMTEGERVELEKRIRAHYQT